MSPPPYPGDRTDPPSIDPAADGTVPPLLTPVAAKETARRPVRLPTAPATTLELIAETAEDWGATWEPEGAAGGRLRLPVSAGLRHGWVAGRLRVASAPGGASDVAFSEESAEYRLWVPAVAVLTLAAAGALVTMLWPFFPRLLGAAPLGALLALSAWFMILSRLRNQGVEEFLEQVAAYAEPAEEGGIPSSTPGF